MFDSITSELLFFSLHFFQIGGSDPLPHSICIQCEQDVNVFYMKIKRFRTLEKKWRGEVYRANPAHPYLNLQQYYDVSFYAPSQSVCYDCR